MGLGRFDVAARGAIVRTCADSVAGGALAPEPIEVAQICMPVRDGPRTNGPRRLLVAAAAAPAAAALGLIALLIVAETTGRTPLTYPMPGNLAEAAGMGMGSEVLRMLRAGQNPKAVMPVRPDIISPSVTRVTAVEAAVWGRRVRLLRLLEREGAISKEERQYVACLATIARVPEIVEEFAPNGVVGCDEERVTRALEGRLGH